MTSLHRHHCPAQEKLADPGYAAWHADALKRYKTGQRQRYCVVCGLWRWRDEEAICPVAETIDAREFERRMRQGLKVIEEGG